MLKKLFAAAAVAVVAPSVFAADPAVAERIREISLGLDIAVTPIGHAGVGAGIMLTHHAQRITLPARLGFMH